MIRKPNGLSTAAITHTARIYTLANQAMTAFSDTVITLGSLDLASGSYVSTATANKLVAVVDGVYLANFEVWFAGGSAGDRNVALKSGTTSLRETGVTTAGRVSGSAVARLAAGAVIGINAYVSVNSVTIQGSAIKDVGLTLTYLGPAA